MNNIAGDIGVNFCKKYKVFHNLTKFLMATELQLFVLVRVTVNAPLVRVSLVRVTCNWYSCQCECGL